MEAERGRSSVLDGDQVARLLTVADDCDALLDIAEPEERTRACASLLGLSNEHTRALLDRVRTGRMAPTPTRLIGGYHKNLALSVDGVDAVVRTELPLKDGAGVVAAGTRELRTWSEPDFLRVVGPQVAEIDAVEARRAVQEGRPVTHLLLPELLHASGGRQIHRWCTGEHVNLRSESGLQAFLGRFVPENLARLAQVTDHPPLAAGGLSHGDTVADAHAEIDFIQRALDHALEQPGVEEVFVRSGFPLQLTGLHDLADTVTPRRPVVRHGDPGADNSKRDHVHGVEWWYSLDPEYAGLGDWVRDGGWAAAKARFTDVPPWYADAVINRMHRVDPDLTVGSRRDLGTYLIIAQANMGVGGLTGAIRESRKAASLGRHPLERTVKQRVGRVVGHISGVQRAVGDGPPLDGQQLREILLGDAAGRSGARPHALGLGSLLSGSDPGPDPQPSGVPPTAPAWHHQAVRQFAAKDRQALWLEP